MTKQSTWEDVLSLIAERHRGLSRIFEQGLFLSSTKMDPDKKVIELTLMSWKGEDVTLSMTEENMLTALRLHTEDGS